MKHISSFKLFEGKTMRASNSKDSGVKKIRIQR